MSIATIEQMPKSFSSDWWDYFYRETGRMTVPNVIENVFSDDVLELREMVYEMLQNMKNDKNMECRIWVDGKKDDKYNQLVANDPIKNEADLIPWQKRLFGDKKFGVVLRKVERYSIAARDKILSHFAPFLTDKTPFGGIHFTIFLGNYGWTPFGIHQDHPGSFVNHYHLGPGEKTMYMWEEDNYVNKLGCKQNDMDAERLIPYADHICKFKAGDIFFMPWNYYHVGNTQELSIGLTVWFSYTTVNGLLSGVWESGLSDLYKNNANRAIVQNMMSIDDGEPFESLLEDLNQASLSTSIENLVKEQIDDHANASISNLWFDSPQLKISNTNTTLAEDNLLQLNDSKIVYKQVNNKIKIFHRGHKLKIIYHPDIISLIDSINTEEIIPVKELLENRFTQWPDGAGLRVLEILHENGMLTQVGD